MLNSWKIAVGVALSVTALCFCSGAQASIVDWNGQDSFNNSSNSIAFTPFTADQLTSISGPGTYEASVNRYGQGVSTTFTLAIDLNSIWTTIDTWTTSDTNEQLLSDLSTPLDFATGLVSGIKLSENPAGSDGDPTYSNFNSFDYWDWQSEQEQFTFNNVSSTPLPATLPLFGSVIGAGFLGLRRRRKALPAAAA